MPRHRGTTESQILLQQGENRALLERVLSNLEPAMLMHWQSFSSLISQARTLPSIAQIAARAGLEASGARSARVMMLVEDELDTLAVANEVGVSSFDGAGLSFETVAFDGVYKEALKKDRLIFESERVIVPLLARDRIRDSRGTGNDRSLGGAFKVVHQSDCPFARGCDASHRTNPP